MKKAKRFEFIKFIKLVSPLRGTLFIGLSVQVSRINDRKKMPTGFRNSKLYELYN